MDDDRPEPDPERVRAALALLPDDEVTRIIREALDGRRSLGEVIGILGEASRRAVAIETMICTPRQQWVAVRRRNSIDT